MHCNVCGAVYQAAQDVLQNTTRAVGGSNLLGAPTPDDTSSPLADDSAALDENPDEAGWIYTDRPPPSD